MAKALFLDRDGTLIEHVPYLHDPALVQLVPGARQALALARDRGWLLFLFSNQSGVGRGLFALEEVHRVNRRMLELIGLGADLFTRECIAPEAPGQPSLYRKPSPVFITECLAAHDLAPGQAWMIGDTLSDWQAGLNAGIRSAAVRSNLFTTEAAQQCAAMKLPVFSNLLPCVECLTGPETGSLP